MQRSVKVEGLPELIKALRLFENKVFNKGLKKAFRDGSKIIQKAVKDETPKGSSGLLKKAIKVRASKRKKNRIGVNVQIGQGSFKGESFYGGFIEFGTKNSEGKAKIKARRFMKKGFDKAKDSAGKRMIESLRESITNAAYEAKREAA